MAKRALVTGGSGFLGSFVVRGLLESGFERVVLLVRDAAERIPVSIVRPGQIVGDSKTGFAATFNTLYYPLKLYLKGQLPVLPVSAQQKLNMVPVDFVAQLVVRALLDPEARGKTFHAVVPGEFQPAAGQMLAFVRDWARSNLGFDPGSPLCMPVPFSSSLGRRRNLAPADAPKGKGFMQNLLALAPYFSERREYDIENARSLMGDCWPSIRARSAGDARLRRRARACCRRRGLVLHGGSGAPVGGG